MKQRFDLIGCEKVSRSGPAGEIGEVQRAGGWNEGWLASEASIVHRTRTNAKSF